MEKTLQRDENSKMIGGVAAGLAEYFDVDVTWVRVGFILAVLAGLSGILAYIVLWIAVPAKPYVLPGTFNADYKVHEEKQYTRPLADFKGPFKSEKKGNGQMIAGIVLIAIGFIFLTDQFNFLPFWFSFHKLWPLALIIPGIIILTKANRNTPLQHTPAESFEKKEPVFEKKGPVFEKKEPLPDTGNTNQDEPLT